MYKVSSKTHGIIDLVTSGMMMVLPRVLGCSKSCCRVLDSMALSTLGLSLCTNYEFGLARFIPFKAHLLTDAIGGAGLIGCASFNDHLSDNEGFLVAGFGAFEIAAAAMTETTSATELMESVPNEVGAPGSFEREEGDILVGERI